MHIVTRTIVVVLNKALNFFELFGLMLKDKAIEETSAEVLISFWCVPYLQSVSNKLHPKQTMSYIEASRQELKDESLWSNAEKMALSFVAKPETFDIEKLRKFLLNETQL